MHFRCTVLTLHKLYAIIDGIIELQIAHPCQCELDGPTSVAADAFVEVTAQYTGTIYPGPNCDNPPNFVWFDDCALGDINQNGLFTVPATTVSETCTICFLDTANTDVNTGEPINCCMSIEIWDCW